MRFENGLSNAFVVNPLGATLIHEEPDSGAPWTAPGPMGPAPSNRQLQTDQPLHVHLRFNVSGMLASVLPGQWKAELFFEQYGGREANPGQYENSVPAVLAISNDYNIVVSVPANELDPGVYKMAVAATFYSVTGLPLPISGFEEIGPIRVYEG
jgi:hypothetical protein